MTWSFDDEIDEHEAEHLLALLADVNDGNGGIIESVVVAVSYIDQDGEPSFSHRTWGGSFLRRVGLIAAVQHHELMQPYVDQDDD